MHKPKIAVAGRGTMGKPLLERLEKEEFPVEFSFNRQAIFCGTKEYASFGHQPIQTIREVARKLDPFVDEKKVEVMFLATPSGPHELPLIQYCIERNIYVILFCKHALAYHYAELFPKRYMIGANATVGGRTMILPWLRMQYLDGRKFVLYAYLNASTNFYMQDAVDNGSAIGTFEDAKDLRLAEPGSTDFVTFLNEEIGGDYSKKLSILMNDTILGGESFITPRGFDYVALKEHNVLSLTQPTRNLRYLVRIENLGLEPEFDSRAPGSLWAKHAGFIISGGFYDLSRDTHVARWMKGGKSNGVQIRFASEHSYEGASEIAGLGAGPATVGAAMNDLYEYLRARDGRLVEARWPKQAA